MGLKPLQSSSPTAFGRTWAAGRDAPASPVPAPTRTMAATTPVQVAIRTPDRRVFDPNIAPPRLDAEPRQHTPVCGRAQLSGSPNRLYARSGGLDQSAQPARLAARRGAMAARRRGLAARLPDRLGHLHPARPAVLADVEVHLDDAEREAEAARRAHGLERALGRRRRRRGGAGGARGGGRVPEGPGPVREARRAGAEGRAPLRPPGDGQDPAGEGGRARVRGQLLLPERLVVRRDVERSRGRPDPAAVPDGAQEPAGHHLHRRAGRRRPPPRQRRAGRRAARSTTRP